MNPDPPRVVFDCNIFFQALINEQGPAGKCVTAALIGKVTLFVSPFIMSEIRRTASDPILRAKFRQLSDARVDLLIANIEKIGHVVSQIPEQFSYQRDPDDAHYVNLALAANAKYVVSRDNDLLDLMDASRPEGQEFQHRFPSLLIIEPLTLLRELTDYTPQGQATTQ